MKAVKSLVKVFFNLGDADWHRYDTESAWAESVSSSRYRLRNTPFFAKNVSAEDVIFVKEQDGVLVYESTSIAAGHSTYRILINKDLPSKHFEKYWKPLEKLGCTYESADREKTILLAIDVPPFADIHEVYRLLDKGEEEGFWSFEEGHCGHVI